MDMWISLCPDDVNPVDATARKLTPERVAAAAGVLARAMDADPAWIYTFPDPATRVSRMTRLFDLIVGRHYLGLGASLVVEDGAAAIWVPPGKRDVPWPTAVGLAPRLGWLVRWRVPAALQMLIAMERRAPREPHYYLMALGVEPGQQGRGLGAAVVRPVLERCDADGTLAWLESGNPKNHAFYRRLGFEVAAERRFGDGPTLTWFIRQPRR